MRSLKWEPSRAHICARTGEQKADLQAEIDAILASKKPAPEFQHDPMPDGVPITGLVFNEERPNISLQTRRTGRVAIRESVDAATGGGGGSDVLARALERLPQVINTFQYRNYTMIADRNVNVDELPLRMSGATWARLRRSIRLRGPATTAPTAPAPADTAAQEKSR